MNEYIGISEDKLHHILGVARKAYKIAKDMGCTEDFARKMFMIGWVHDVGYEFSKEASDHPRISSGLVHQLICSRQVYDMQMSLKTNYAIFYHGAFPDESLINNIEWRIINMADMMIDSKGNEVTVKERLSEIKARYGEDSDQYIVANKICRILGLI